MPSFRPLPRKTSPHPSRSIPARKTARPAMRKADSDPLVNLEIGTVQEISRTLKNHSFLLNFILTQPDEFYVDDRVGLRRDAKKRMEELSGVLSRLKQKAGRSDTFYAELERAMRGGREFRGGDVFDPKNPKAKSARPGMRKASGASRRYPENAPKAMRTAFDEETIESLYSDLPKWSSRVNVKTLRGETGTAYIDNDRALIFTPGDSHGKAARPVMRKAEVPVMRKSLSELKRLAVTEPDPRLRANYAEDLAKRMAKADDGYGDDDNEGGGEVFESDTMSDAELMRDFEANGLGFHENVTFPSEHGQRWAMCSACGASWSVVDSNTGIDFEEIDEGDESCLENSNAKRRRSR